MNQIRSSEAVACYRRPARANRLLNRPERGCLTGGVDRQPSQVWLLLQASARHPRQAFRRANGNTGFGAGPAPKFSRRRVSDFLSLSLSHAEIRIPWPWALRPVQESQYPQVPLTLTVLLLLRLCLFSIIHSSPDSLVITLGPLAAGQESAGRWSQSVPFASTSAFVAFQNTLAFCRWPNLFFSPLPAIQGLGNTNIRDQHHPTTSPDRTPNRQDGPKPFARGALCRHLQGHPLPAGCRCRHYPRRHVGRLLLRHRHDLLRRRPAPSLEWRGQRPRRQFLFNTGRLYAVIGVAGRVIVFRHVKSWVMAVVWGIPAVNPHLHDGLGCGPGEWGRPVDGDNDLGNRWSLRPRAFGKDDTLYEIRKKKDRGQASPGGCSWGAVEDKERRHRLQYSERASEGLLEAHNFEYIISWSH